MRDEDYIREAEDGLRSFKGFLTACGISVALIGGVFAVCWLVGKLLYP